LKNQTEIQSGAVAWMASHKVASNLIMILIVLGGVMSVFRLKQEVFPEFSLDMISIAVPFPGASPGEVEQGIVLLLEERVRGVNGVKRVTSSAKEGLGSVTVEVLLGEDPEKVLADIKNEVDRISNFPLDAEAPIVSMPAPRRGVVSLLISGDADLNDLHQLAEKARSEMLAMEGITQVDLKGVPPLEVEVSVRREVLESMGLSLDDISNQIRSASIELGGGTLDTKKGKILVRVSDRKYERSDFLSIPIRASNSGTEIPLGEIAQIKDGYADSDVSYWYNGKRAVELQIYRVGKETPSGVADAVRAYKTKLETELPSTISLEMWNDDSLLLKGRIDLLVRNAISGLILVIIILGLFLQRRLALWVAAAIPICFLGAFLLMSWFDISINMITLFALIVTLGMVVDDGIVVAENIFEKMQSGMPRLQASIEGTKEMIAPVTFSILTSIAAFAPMFFVPGVMGKIFYLIPAVVCAVLLISLFECYFILPSHLSQASSDKKSGWLGAHIDRGQEACNRWLQHFVDTKFRRVLEFALKRRHLTMALATATLLIVIATVPSGILKFSFFPKIDGDVVSANFRLPFGVPLEKTEDIASKLQVAAKKIMKHFGEDKFKGEILTLGEGLRQGGPHGGSDASGSHLLSLSIAMVESDDRDFSAEEFAVRWKESLPEILGVESMTFGSVGGPSSGKSVDFQLSHYDEAQLAKASQELAEVYSDYPALKDIENTFSQGKPQIDFKLREGAQTLGVTAIDVARALRASFYGAEALREQRGRNEIKVMTRLPLEQRNSEEDLKNLLIRTRSGNFIRLGEITDLKYVSAPTEISREDGRRIVNVSADLVPGRSTEAEINRTLKEGPLLELQKKYPGLQIGVSGMAKEQKESFASLGPNYLFALVLIFGLLAIPFRSYTQPLIVMSAIPFGFVGAFLGHLVLGETLTFISVMGIIALSGVVVNDSLVLIVAVNQYRAQGFSVHDALVQAGIRRFRPILLTSLTTFFGLMPMILETSMQAKFLIPMAISLGFGVLFTTPIVLIIIPALYLIVDDARRLLSGRI
jgi:multidrug efflux pump subunit AcrB